MIGRVACGTLCGNTAQRLARPGAYWKTWFSIPSASRIFLKNCAACISLPGGLVVSIRKYCCIHCTARSEYCCRWSAEIRAEASPGVFDCAIEGTHIPIETRKSADTRSSTLKSVVIIKSMRAQEKIAARSFYTSSSQIYRYPGCTPPD